VPVISQKSAISPVRWVTADENGGLEGSVGADLRGATNLTRATAATERGGHLEACIFMKVRHDLFKFTTADENGSGDFP
jgi:hypothetical protein